MDSKEIAGYYAERYLKKGIDTCGGKAIKNLLKNQEVLKYSHEKQTLRLRAELFHNLILFRFFSVLFLELVDTSCSVYQHILTSKERVRRI